MYEISFLNPIEIRMGSPFNLATVVIKGSFLPDLSNASFQDKGIVSKDKLSCYLIEWVTSSNEPAFRVWKLDESSRTVSKSQIIPGCCESISIENSGKISVLVFQNGKSITQTIQNFS